MEDGSIKLVDKKDLPLILPRLNDYKAKNGKAPLDNAQEWVNVQVDGEKGKRETSTMPGAAASSWYFLRYIDPKNDKEFCNLTSPTLEEINPKTCNVAHHFSNILDDIEHATQ